MQHADTAGVCHSAPCGHTAGESACMLYQYCQSIHPHFMFSESTSMWSPAYAQGGDRDKLIITSGSDKVSVLIFARALGRFVAVSHIAVARAPEGEVLIQWSGSVSHGQGTGRCEWICPTCMESTTSPPMCSPWSCPVQPPHVPCHILMWWGCGRGC